MSYYDIKVSSSGAGDAEVISGYPFMKIYDSLFVFDLNLKNFDYLKTFYKENKINNTTIFQLERYKDIEEFKEALRQLINYGIFENQNLCDKLFVLSTKDEYTKATNEIWPKEQKAITKFRNRKWPTEEFCKEFLPISGCGSVSPAPELIDKNNLVSWFFELGYTEYEDSITFSFDPENPEFPIPIQPGVTPPEIPEPETDSTMGTPMTYSIIYYHWNEVTSFPVVKNIARPFNNLVTSNAIPQNTVTVHVTKQLRVEIVKNESTSSDS